MQCPPDFVGIPLIIEAASFIGKRLRMSPKAKSKWPERPCLWGGIIGASGTNKSAALAAALEPIARIQQAMAAEHKEASLQYLSAKMNADAAEKNWRAETKKAQKDGQALPPRPKEAEKPAEPVMKQVVTV